MPPYSEIYGGTSELRLDHLPVCLRHLCTRKLNSYSAEGVAFVDCCNIN